MKPDALSCQFSPPNSSEPEKSIIPPSCVVGTLTWAIESDIREAQQSEPEPGTGPLLFIPSYARTKVLDGLHSSKFSCHPGVVPILTLAKKHFWCSLRTKTFKILLLHAPPVQGIRIVNNPSWTSPTSTHPEPSLVPHLLGLHHWFTPIGWYHNHFDCD